MGVNSMVSGRNPSMLRMSARAGPGIGVTVCSGATTGVTVSVGGWKGVTVEGEVSATVGAGSGVETAGRHEVRNRSVRSNVRGFFITNL